MANQNRRERALEQARTVYRERNDDLEENGIDAYVAELAADLQTVPHPAVYALRDVYFKARPDDVGRDILTRELAGEMLRAALRVLLEADIEIDRGVS